MISSTTLPKIPFINLGVFASQYIFARSIASFIETLSGIFKSDNPEKRARAIVLATTYYNDPKKLAEVSEDLGEAMFGINANELETRYEERGW